MSSPVLRIGTAGWTVPSRYIADVALGGSHLERYARRLNAVEINSSFYRPHQRKTYERWAASTPSGFRFAVKIPKAITHERRLVDCADLLDRFADEVTGLGDKLGVLLVQLPPSLAYAAATANRFFRDLRARIAVPIAFEPRHASWFRGNVEDWLTKRGIARVAADPPPADGADVPRGWSGLAYYRWHGSPHIYDSDYDAAALAELKLRLVAHLEAGSETWCIFDNTKSGAALGNALSLQASKNTVSRSPCM